MSFFLEVEQFSRFQRMEVELLETASRQPDAHFQPVGRFQRHGSGIIGNNSCMGIAGEGTCASHFLKRKWNKWKQCHGSPDSHVGVGRFQRTEVELMENTIIGVAIFN